MASRVALVLAVSLLAKLVVLLWGFPERPGIVVNPDTPSYVRPALALLHAGSFSPDVDRVPEPELNRTPGYPAIVAAVYALFGERLAALAVTNTVLSTATLGLLFLLGRRLFGERAAFIAVVLLSLDPGSFRYSLVALTETPFTFLVLLGILLLVLAADSPRRSVLLALAGGLALSAATLVRPLTFYFLPVLVVLLPVCLPGWRRPRMLAAFLAPVLLVVGGWQVRNYVRGGTASFTLNQSVEIYLIRAAYVQALVEEASVLEVRERLGWTEGLHRFGYLPDEGEAFGGRRYADLHPATASLSLPELARLYNQRGREILLAHPFQTIRMVAHGALYLFLTPPFLIWQYHWGNLVPDDELLREYFHPSPAGVLSWLSRNAPGTFALTLLWIPLLALFALLALRGALRSLRSRPALLVLATFAFLAAVTAGPSCIDDRYRVPLVPFLCLFAARGLGRGPVRPSALVTNAGPAVAEGVGPPLPQSASKT